MRVLSAIWLEYNTAVYMWSGVQCIVVDKKKCRRDVNNFENASTEILQNRN